MMEKIIVEMGDFIREHPSLHKKNIVGANYCEIVQQIVTNAKSVSVRQHGAWLLMKYYEE